MLKPIFVRTKQINLLLCFWIGIQQCYSTTTTYSTTSTQAPKVDESSTFEIIQNLSMINNLTDSHKKNPIEDVHQYVLCEIISRDLTWENASCEDSLMGTDVVCLPINDDCVNLDDNIHPCNMTCRQEYERMSAQCPILSKETKESIKLAKFLLDGVLKLLLAILGVLGNIVAILVLRRPSMRNPFNYLLIALAVIDIAYLFEEMLRCFAERFELGTYYYNIQYGYMSYPLRHISQSASVFMTIAITFERYCAVHHPINYNQSMNNEILTRRRLVRYLTPVLILSVLYNINRFFEAELDWRKEDCYENETNCTYIPKRLPTLLRMENETYNVFVLTVRCLILGLFPLMILGFLNSKIYKDVQERRARNVPLGSSSISNGGRGQGATSRGFFTTIGIPLAREESPDSGRLDKLSKLKNTLSLRRYRKKSPAVRRKDDTFNPPERNGVKATILLEELEPLRRLKCNQNKSNVAHCPKVATVETLKIVAVGQSKRESSSKIQTVFKRSKSPKLKNKRIPELIETPQLVHSTTNDYSHSLTHLSASAVLSMQSNIPNIQKNEEIHNSPEYIETTFPIQSSCTPSESFEKEERTQDEMEYIQNQLPLTSSFEEDFSDLRSLGANESGSISSKSTIPRFGKRKSSLITSNQITENVMKESQNISQSQINGTAGKHVLDSNNSSICSKAGLSDEPRCRAMTKTSFVDSEYSGTIKKSRTFSKSLRIPLQSKICTSPCSEERRRKKESGRNKPAFSRTQRRKHEDHLAMIFLGFIFVFLLCHLPRILLDIHELVTREHYRTCRQFRHHDFPAYISISIFISHVMLVISSATNLLIYCSLSSTYRKEVLDFFAQTYNKIRECIYKP